MPEPQANFAPASQAALVAVRTYPNNPANQAILCRDIMAIVSREVEAIALMLETDADAYFPDAPLERQAILAEVCFIRARLGP